MPAIQVHRTRERRDVSTIEQSLHELIERVTLRFIREKERDEKEGYRDAARQESLERLSEKNAEKQQELTIKKAAWSVMKKAYLLASDNGTLPATMRQIMYACRPLVLGLIGRCWKNSNNFTQDLLPDYMEAHAEETAKWDVVADARGHFAEPHTTESVGIGTLEVRDYLNSWTDGEHVSTLVEPPKLSESYFPTSGPTNRYKFAVYIEKEGFMPILKRAQIAERFDVAIFSSKGMPVVEARRLVDKLSQVGVTTLIVHDFDRDGLKIAHWLCHDNERYTFEAPPKTIDLGLRLKDVQKMKLQSEALIYEQEKDPGDLLDDWDIPPEEGAFLVKKQLAPKLWAGQRVELNALRSRQFINWLEAKFRAVGIKKVIPEQATLVVAWKRSLMAAEVNEAVERVREQFRKERRTEPMPRDIEKHVRDVLRRHPELPWDAAVGLIASKRGKR
jgi:hypothetical protein